MNENLSEPERQLLIAIGSAEDHPVDSKTIDSIGHETFRKYREEWRHAVQGLEGRGFLTSQGGLFALTEMGRATAEALRVETPKMYYWYTEFYEATASSKAYTRLCEDAYGIDFSQHGFVDRCEMDALLQRLPLDPTNRVLEIGCGTGGIAEYISDQTGASIIGIDYTHEAVRRARERTGGKEDRLRFEVADLTRMSSRIGCFDTILSIDTIYFSDDLSGTIRHLREHLVPEGRMAFCYGSVVWNEGDPRSVLDPDGTPLALALQANGMHYRVWDRTEESIAFYRRLKAACDRHRSRLESEGNHFLVENRTDEAEGGLRLYQRDAMRRFIYVACS